MIEKKLSVSRHSFLWICLITACLIFPSKGFGFYHQQTDSLSEKIEAFFGERHAIDPGAVLIVTQNGDEIYRSVFGKANLETCTDITDETVFEAASVTKQFTAAAILLLIEQQKLKLEDDVRQYVPELPEYGSPITIQHLLTHTSGLKDWRNVVYLTPWPTGERLYTQGFALDLICKQTNLNFKPGDQYRYTNSGYDLLATIVERITEQSFASFVKQNLLEPAGMTHSHIRGKYTDIILNKANGYLTSYGQYIQGQTMDETYGAAGLLTTAGDLQKWNAYVYSDRVSDRFKTMRLSQFVLNNGQEIPYANGGVEVHQHNGHAVISHGGLISGYRAWVAYIPDKKVSLTYMSNDRNISSSGLAKTVVGVFLGKEIPAGGDQKSISAPSMIDEIAGIYQNVDDDAYYLDLNIQNGKLVSSQKTAQFIGKNSFVLDDKVYRYKKGVLTHPSSTGIVTYRSVASFSPDPQTLDRYIGTYYSADCDVKLTLTVKNGKLVAERSSYDTFTLTPLYEDGKRVTFRGLTNGLRTLFHFTSQADQTLQLTISLPRAAHIPFIKQ